MQGKGRASHDENGTLHPLAVVVARSPQWGWEDLNFRPYAYQAGPSGPGFRHKTAKPLMLRAICRVTGLSISD